MVVLGIERGQSNVRDILCKHHVILRDAILNISVHLTNMITAQVYGTPKQAVSFLILSIS